MLSHIHSLDPPYLLIHVVDMPYVNKSWSLNKFNKLKKEINSVRKGHNYFTGPKCTPASPSNPVD